MNEDYKHFLVQVGDEEIEASPENTSLQTYAGTLALYNNVIVRHPANEQGRTEALVVFKGHSAYKALKQVIRDRKYPQYLNMTEVPEKLQEVYLNEMMGDLDETPEWLE